MSKTEVEYTNYLEFLQNLKQFFKACREKKGLNFIETAKELDLTPGVIMNYERGDTGITLRMLLKMLDYFGYNLMIVPKGKKYIEVKN